MKKYFNKELIFSLYRDGLSSIEIKERLDINISVRQIQRLISQEGITRDSKKRFVNAIERGRMIYQTNPNKIRRIGLSRKIRFLVYEKFGYRCVLCGNTPKDSRIQIDHIDNDKNNNDFTNLQVLCEECNYGKWMNWKDKANR